jgi:hypothetical protein
MNAFYATLFFTILFGAVAWLVMGAALNVAIPVIALVICCERLASVYYEIAYWLPLATGAAVSGLTFIAARKAFDPAA